MVTEYNYWLENHSVEVEKPGGTAGVAADANPHRRRKMFRYNCKHDGPRPESYLEDFELVKSAASDEEEKRQMYWEMKTGAETGWDYSTRWMIPEEKGAELGELKVRTRGST